MGNTKAKRAATDTTMHDVPAKTMFRFRLRDLLLLTAWLSLCLSLGVCLELNTTGMVVAFVGCGLSIVGLLCGRLDRGILAALALYALCAVPSLTRVSVGSGHKPVAVQVMVSDLNAKRPIDGASITLHDLGAERELGSSRVPTLGRYTSDSDGSAIILLELPLTVHTTPCTESVRVHCSEWLQLRVDRSGYESVDCNLADRIGRSFKPNRKPLHVHIEMQPSEKPNTGGH